MSTRGPRAKHWCVTWNNPPYTVGNLDNIRHVEHVIDILHPVVRYAVFQRERGGSGTLHYQMYIEFKVRRELSSIKILLENDGLHAEKRTGPRDKARDYCKKEDSRVDGPWEVGDWSDDAQGHRSDLERICDLAREGKGYLAIVREVPKTALRYGRGLATLVAAYAPDRSGPCKVSLIVGQPGIGKTRYVMDTYGSEVYKKRPGDAWFDGYDAQPVILLDEFGGRMSRWRLDLLLYFLDEQTPLMEVKGNIIKTPMKEIWITTNIHPRDWFEWDRREMQYVALCRRIHHVYTLEEYQLVEKDRDEYFQQWTNYVT